MTAAAEKLKVAVFAFQKGNVEIDIPDTLSVLGDDMEKPKKHGLFRIINQKDGDKRVIWNSQSLDEIKDAQKMFDDLIKEGLTPYYVDPKGKKTPEKMSDFDPTAEEIVFAPIKALRGG